MRSALLAALLVSAALAARESSTLTARPGAGEEREREPDQEDESDSAPFMIVVEHADGRRCSGSLVSLRTALTSARCVRGEPRELWALAPGAAAVRRVARVALAAGAEPARAPASWDGAAMDLAVLELEAPFGGGARSRPILMATRPGECAAGAVCHVVRALGRAPRLRIVDATLVDGGACAERARGWPGLRDSALCLVGPTLCSSDWGAGVVCDGKLCGVLSRSVSGGPGGAEGASGAGAGGAGGAGSAVETDCGDTHVAQSVSRWRRFLHCAHTLRACGRGGDCAQLCSERRLMDTDVAEGGGGGGGGEGGGASTRPLAPAPPRATARPSSAATDTPAPTAPTAPTALTTPPSTALTTRVAHSRRTAAPRQSKPTPAAAPPSRSTAPPPRHDSAQPSPRPSFEFEPNRPDFKAGEYGDNGADYGGEESAPQTGTGSAATTQAEPPAAAAEASAGAPGASVGAAPPGRERLGHVQAQQSPPARRSPAAPAAAPLSAILLILVTITNIAI